MSAAGVLGVVAMCIAMSERCIPGQLNLDTALPAIQGCQGLALSSEHLEMNKDQSVVGTVSGTSASGDNIHLVLQQTMQHRSLISTCDRHVLEIPSHQSKRDFKNQDEEGSAWSGSAPSLSTDHCSDDEADYFSADEELVAHIWHPGSAETKQSRLLGLESLLLMLVEQHTGSMIDADVMLLDYGVTSVVAMRIVNGMQHQLGPHLQLDVFSGIAALFNYPKVRELALHISTLVDLELVLTNHPIMNPHRRLLPSPAALDRVQVLNRPSAIHSSDLLPPLFLAAGGLGTSAVFAQLASRVGTADRFIYGLDRGSTFNVDDLSQQHVVAIQELVPDKCIHIGGYSHGGWVAARTATLLQQAGFTVHSILLIDSYHPGHPPTVSLLRQYLLSVGVPSTVIDDTDPSKALQEWLTQEMSGHLTPFNRLNLERFGDELGPLLTSDEDTFGTDIAEWFPQGWCDESSTAFSDLAQSATNVIPPVVLFNATHQVSGEFKNEVLWRCDNLVRVVDLAVDHMRVLTNDKSFDTVCAVINEYLEDDKPSLDDRQ